MNGTDATPGEDTAPIAESPSVSVVVVDDDAFAAEMLERMLVDAGHRVRRFAAAEPALQDMRREPPDVLLTDWVMPGMDGPALIDEMRATPSLVGTYCILLTAYDAAGRKVEGLSHGADDYVPKGAVADELLVRVRVGARVRSLERTASLLTMATTLGHEINNPLTAVLVNLDLVEQHCGPAAPEEGRLAIDRARAAAARISDVVRRLVNLSDARLKSYRHGSVMLDLTEDA